MQTGDVVQKYLIGSIRTINKVTEHFSILQDSTAQSYPIIFYILYRRLGKIGVHLAKYTDCDVGVLSNPEEHEVIELR